MENVQTDEFEDQEMTKRVFLFDEGGKDDWELLGNKGANLSEMMGLGLPIPQGFVITTSTCLEYFQSKSELPEGLREEYLEALGQIEEKSGKKFGDPENPLLLSVRSGAAVSMPGMMDTVLNLGINDEIAAGLARKTSNPRFAMDTYRRFIQMFANVVMGVEREKFEEALTAYKEGKGYSDDLDMDGDDWKAIIEQYKSIVSVPTDPHQQLTMAIEAVFNSWYIPRAVKYREYNNISQDLGTAANVQEMVFGNMGNTSGTGVAFTRDPSTGEHVFYGEYLLNAEGEDVVAGIRTPNNLDQLKNENPQVYDELFKVQQQLENHFGDMQDLEFTIEDGRLFILQTRNGKRTAKAAIKIVIDQVAEGLITKEQALLRIDPEQIEFLLHPMIDPDAEREVIATGLPASPGAATGKIVFSADEAERLKEEGEKVIMVRRETSPEDIHGMKAAEGILTELGGMTSHAAVVARGMGKSCISGCSDISIDYNRGTFKTKDGEVFNKMDVITLDGASGEVIRGDVPKIEAEFDQDFRTLLSWADQFRGLKVRANAETPEDARVALDLGAEGIGLCRTEHMFFGEERIDVIRSLILAENGQERKECLDKLYDFQKSDMVELFKIMNGLPLTIRLLDPPWNEFLPNENEDIRALAGRLGRDYEEIKNLIKNHTESNPMMGMRGCRLSIMNSDITRMQTKAIMNAAVEVKKAGQPVHPEIMVPLIISTREFEYILKDIKEAINEVRQETGMAIDCKIGTMMEVPRACIRAGSIATHVEFMSFGTNDLTQMTLGISRDDVSKFLGAYLKNKIFLSDPFVTLDRPGVGILIQQAIRDSRKTNGNIEYGICGEHGGDPLSIQFFQSVGLDYVSCSPFRVPIARIASAQCSIREAQGK